MLCPPSKGSFGPKPDLYEAAAIGVKRTSRDYVLPSSTGSGISPPALSLIPTDEDRFRDRVLACLSLNVTAGRIGLCLKIVHREGKQPEVIMMRPMAVRWARAAIAQLPKIVDRLLHFGDLRGVDCKFRYGWRNIVNRPMMPCAGGRIGIVAEQDKTPRCLWRAGPLQRWREIFSITGKSSRNCGTIGEGA